MNEQTRKDEGLLSYDCWAIKITAGAGAINIRANNTTSPIIINAEEYPTKALDVREVLTARGRITLNIRLGGDFTQLLLEWANYRDTEIAVHKIIQLTPQELLTTMGGIRTPMLFSHVELVLAIEANKELIGEWDWGRLYNHKEFPGIGSN